MLHGKLQNVTVRGDDLSGTLRRLADAINTVNGRSSEQGITVDWYDVTVNIDPYGWWTTATAYYGDPFGNEVDVRSIT